MVFSVHDQKQLGKVLKRRLINCDEFRSLGDAISHLVEGMGLDTAQLHKIMGYAATEDATGGGGTELDSAMPVQTLYSFGMTHVKIMFESCESQTDVPSPPKSVFDVLKHAQISRKYLPGKR